MANLVKVSLTKLDSRTFNESVIINTNLIEDVYEENNITKIKYQYKGMIKRMEVSESLSALNDAIGSYVNNVRLQSLTIETIDNIKSNSTHSVSVDDVLWVDKFTATSVRMITSRAELVATISWSNLLSEANGWTSSHKLSGLAYLACRFEWKKIEDQDDADANPPIFHKKTIDTTCREFFNSKSEILDFLRRKRKTHHIFFRNIEMDRFDESEFDKPSGYTKDNYCLRLYACER